MSTSLLPAGIPADSIIDAILIAQRPSGAFASTMNDQGRYVPDDNGFVTARVLAEAGSLCEHPRLHAAIERALDFLESCEARELPGGFRFWPDSHRPPQVPRYPPDADDTALIAVQLARHGRLTGLRLRRLVADTVIRHRVGDRPPVSWVRSGAFWTWLDRGFGYNVVDCTVNANVVTLICTAGLRGIIGYEAACEMIDDAVRRSCNDPVLLRMLSPYYPCPEDLRDAVGRAVAAGAAELATCLRLLRARLGEAPPAVDAHVCSSAYGKVTWTAPVLRQLHSSTAGITAPETRRSPP